MAENSVKFKVKKGLDVFGDSTMSGNLDVAGSLTVVNQLATDNSTKVANTAFVKTAVANLVATAPAALDTLNELALALGNDPNFATTVTSSLATKAPLASPALTGIPVAPTATAGTITTQLATTEFVTNADNLKAPLVSPALTGIPVAPTAVANTSTTQLATTAFVLGQAAISTPLMAGIAATGTSFYYSRQDHVHASDAAKANLAGAIFTGSVAVNQDILQNGTYAIRQTLNDLILQTDTAKDISFRTNAAVKMILKNSGNLLIGTIVDNGVDSLQVNGSVSATIFKGSAALTGTPTAPTAVAGTSTTQLATTAFATAADNLKANANAASFTGDSSFAGGIGANDGKIIILPFGGKYVGTATTVTGAFKVILPVLYTSTMVKLEISVQENSTGKSFDLTIAGYADGVTNSWLNAGSYMTGNVNSKTPNVRFGNDGTRACVWIGDNHRCFQLG